MQDIRYDVGAGDDDEYVHSSKSSTNTFDKAQDVALRNKKRRTSSYTYVSRWQCKYYTFREFSLVHISTLKVCFIMIIQYSCAQFQ